jgi:hypothetical protein
MLVEDTYLIFFISGNCRFEFRRIDELLGLDMVQLLVMATDNHPVNKTKVLRHFNTFTFTKSLYINFRHPRGATVTVSA